MNNRHPQGRCAASIRYSGPSIWHRARGCRARSGGQIEDFGTKRARSQPGPAAGPDRDQRGLPDSAFHVSNDVRLTAYTGAAPPPGTGKHRYYIAVNALDVPSVTALGITPESTPAALSFSILQHTLARVVLVPWAGEGVRDAPGNPARSSLWQRS